MFYEETWSTSGNTAGINFAICIKGWARNDGEGLMIGLIFPPLQVSRLVGSFLLVLDFACNSLPRSKPVTSFALGVRSPLMQLLQDTDAANTKSF